MWGAADRFQKLAYGERLAAELGAELQTVDHGRHFTPEVHPAEVAGAIRLTLSRAA